MVLDVEKSKGSRLYDAKSQRYMVDFFSFFASNPIGFNHPRMHEKDFEEKILKFARVKVSNSDIYTTAYAEFVESFHKNCAPMFDKLFFIDGGALGVENALKTAQDWKVRKNIKAGKGEKGTQIIHFKEAFHGRTGYTMSLTNTAPEKTLYFPKFDWPRIINPKLTFPLTPQSLQTTIELEKQAEDQIKMAFKDRKDDICAIILETIQGEGGDNMFRAEFLQKLRELADENDVMLIFDEVQCGMGITGKFWAFENFNVMPDLISFGKKVQVCGTAARLKRLEEVDHVYKVPSRINSTFGGNLVDMVRTTQYIDIIVKENLLENTKRMGAFIKKELELLSAADERVTNVRGLGLWLAFDLPTPEIRSELMDECWKNGLIVLACGQKSIRLRPVLNISQDEAVEGLSILRKSIKDLKTQNSGKREQAAR
jgi:L-lysine 6-transaminase